MSGLFARSRGRSAAAGLALLTAVGLSRSAAAQTTGCNFPEAWANARKWTGIFSSTAKGSGDIPSGGTFTITQTFTGTVTLDAHIPLEDAFAGNVNFTVSAHEHYEFPNPGGPPSVVDIVANGSIDPGTDGAGAALAFDFSACKYFFYVAPRGLLGTLNGTIPSPYLLGPTPATGDLDLLTATYLPLPTDSLPDLSDGAGFMADTAVSNGFAAPPIPWVVALHLTPEPCDVLKVPYLNQGTDPWRWDTYDKAFETLPMDPTAALSPGGVVDLLEFPFGVGVSQGNPDAATHVLLSLSGSDNSLQGVDAALASIARLQGPTNYKKKPGSRLKLDDILAGGYNSMQLLTTPGDPKSNIFRNIGQLGCFMTSATMIFDYFGGSIDPRNMNDWLNDHLDGFVGAHSVNSYAIPRFAKEKGVQMKFAGQFNNPNDVTVEKYICSGNPVMLKVSPCNPPDEVNCQHFVVATGKTVANGELTWMINDPGYSQKHDLGAYNGVYFGYRLWTGPKGGPSGASREQVLAAATDESALVLAAAPSFQLTVTDPSGRQLQCVGGIALPGPNPIPDATCTLDAVQNDTDLSVTDTTEPTTIVQAPGPASGDWHVDVVTIDPGDYTVDAIAYDSDGGVTRASATGTGPAVGARYTVSYSSLPGSPVVLTAPAAPDGGSPTPDGGSPASDAGTGTGADAGPSAPPDAGASGGTGGGTTTSGSHSGGCGTGDASVLALIGLMFVALPTRAGRRGFDRSRRGPMPNSLCTRSNRLTQKVG